MTATRLRALLIFLVTAGAALLSHFATPTTHLSDVLGKPDLEKIFPAEFGDWRVDARSAMVLPSPQTQALLNSIYNQTLSRTYINSKGNHIMLSVAYGGDQSDATRAHLPEVCYPAQGFQISHRSKSQLELAGRVVNTTLLMSKFGQRNEPITYWLVVGDRVALSRTEQKLTQFRLGLQGLIPDGMLVRVSNIDPDMSRGHKLQADFLAEMAQAFPQTARDRVFGALNTSR